MLHGMKDKDSYLMQRLPSLYKYNHVKRKTMVARNFWPSLVWLLCVFYVHLVWFFSLVWLFLCVFFTCVTFFTHTWTPMDILGCNWALTPCVTFFPYFISRGGTSFYAEINAISHVTSHIRGKKSQSHIRAITIEKRHTQVYLIQHIHTEVIQYLNTSQGDKKGRWEGKRKIGRLSLCLCWPLGLATLLYTWIGDSFDVYKKNIRLG